MISLFPMPSVRNLAAQDGRPGGARLGLNSPAQKSETSSRLR
jgi:hypothetical protein